MPSKTLQKLEVNSLMSFPNLDLRSPIKDLYLVFSELSVQETEKIQEFGFGVTLEDGRAYLSGDKAVASLIRDELQYIDFDNQLLDFAEYQNWSTQDQVKAIMCYIGPEVTIKEIIDWLKMDWMLTEEEYKNLNKKRQHEDD